MKTRKEYKDYYLNKLLKKFGEFTERDYNSAHEFCYREEWDLGNNINAIDGLGDAWVEYEKRYNNGVQPIEPTHPVNPVKKDPPRPDDKDKQQSGKKGNKNNQPQPNSDKRPGVGENYDGYADDESDITSSPYMNMGESDMIISGYDRNEKTTRALFSDEDYYARMKREIEEKDRKFNEQTKNAQLEMVDVIRNVLKPYDCKIYVDGPSGNPKYTRVTITFNNGWKILVILCGCYGTLSGVDVYYKNWMVAQKEIDFRFEKWEDPYRGSMRKENDMNSLKGKLETAISQMKNHEYDRYVNKHMYPNGLPEGVDYPKIKSFVESSRTIKSSKETLYEDDSGSFYTWSEIKNDIDKWVKDSSFLEMFEYGDGGLDEKTYYEYFEKDHKTPKYYKIYKDFWDISSNGAMSEVEGTEEQWNEYNEQHGITSSRNERTLKALFSEVDEIGNPDDWFENIDYDTFTWLNDFSDFYDWLCKHKSEYPKQQSALTNLSYYKTDLWYELRRVVADLKYDEVPVNIETVCNRLYKRTFDEKPHLTPCGFSKEHNTLYFSLYFMPPYAFELDSTYYNFVKIGVDKNFISKALSDYNNSQSINIPDDNHDPFSEGYNAYMRNDRNCPYKQGTEDFDSWVDGWQEAEMDMKP
ncbi:MAG: hypothetical protein IKS48_10485 [Eubacterium sp.]|nr:hypothetical protein [Eubacterium sp.]